MIRKVRESKHSYTEEDRLEINKQQYDFSLDQGREVFIDYYFNKEIIGIVSHIKDESSTSGLQAYVITSDYVPINARI